MFSQTMDFGGNDPVAKFFLTPESLIAQSKNEDFGDPNTTTLLPLDSNTLEVICRVNLPGVPLTRDYVRQSFNDHGFKQSLILSPTGARFRFLHVGMVQCSSHADALKAMKDAILDREDDWVMGKRRKRLGNYAVEFSDDDAECCIKLIWVRWTSVIAIDSNAMYPSEGNPDQGVVNVKRLASALDKAMKAHKGTITQVSKVTIGLKQSDILRFKKEGQTESIQMTFQADTHPYKWFRVEPLYDAAFDVADRPADSKASSGGKELLSWKSCGDMVYNFPESGIFLRCNKLGCATLRIKIAHKSSLWPTIETFNLH